MFAQVLSAATALVDRLATLDDRSVLLVTVLFSAVEMTFLLGLLVPGESVVMLAASLHGPAGFALAVGAGTMGALAGQTLGYAVGRVFGPRLRETRLGRRIGPDRFDRAEEYLRKRGAPALVAVRFVAVIHAVVPIVAGVARMPFGRFLGWSALGTLLWVGTFASVGAATASADSTGGIGLLLTAVGATCLGVVPLAIRLFRRPAPTGSAAQLIRQTTRPSRRTVRPGGATRPPRRNPQPAEATRPPRLAGATRPPRLAGATRPPRLAGAARPPRWTALLTGPAQPRRTCPATGPLRPAVTLSGRARPLRTATLGGRAWPPRPAGTLPEPAWPAATLGGRARLRLGTARPSGAAQPPQQATGPTRLLRPAGRPREPARPS